MKLLALLLCLLPLTVFAGWKADIVLGASGETVKLDNQNFEEGKESTLKMGNFLLKLTFKKSTEPKTLDVTYMVQEMIGAKATLINKGQDTVEEKTSNDIYAKGEPNQSHSIITIKFKQ